MDTKPNKWIGKNPWLGLGTYREGIPLYGRDTEINTLVDIVSNNIATILFGKSGVGKSSLIHAGIFPKLRNNGFSPVYIRFEHNTEISYVMQIKNAINKEFEKEDILGDEFPIKGLWDFFHRYVFYNNDHQTIVPVLVIDQFEEIYTLTDNDHKHYAQELFDELADLLNNVMPNSLISGIVDKSKTILSKSELDIDRNNTFTFRVHTEKKPKYIEDSLFHFMICLREDYLYYLERNSSKIPSFKINRFSLNALDRKSATDVIMQPRPGLFDVSEANDIITRISTINDEGKEEVDPTILSIFLYKYYCNKGNVHYENVIKDFYLEEINRISCVSISYLEDSLITNDGFRRFLSYNEVISQGVLKEELNILIENRIITIETRKGFEYIEFTHDVISKIALKNRELRHLDEQSRRLKKRIVITTAIITFFLLMSALFIHLNYKVAENERLLRITQTKNISLKAHYMIIQGDVLNAIKLLLNILPKSNLENILPETELILNEAYDSLYSDFSCISILKHDDDVISGKYSKDSKHIITTSNDGFCRIWNGISSEIQDKIKIDSISYASLNKDGSKAIISSQNGYIYIYDLSIKAIVKKMRIKGDTDIIKMVCFSPDEKTAITVSDDYTVKLWDVENSKCLDTIIVHKASVNSAVFSNDGQYIVSASEDGTSLLYNVNNQTLKPVFESTEYTIEAIDISNDNTKVAVVINNEVRIIDIVNHVTKNIISGHNDLITSVAFNPNDSTIVTASYDKTIKLWDLSTSKELHTFVGHTNIVKDVEFSPDGKYILSTSRDNDARIWNVNDGNSNKTINADIGVISSGTYSFDSKYIAAISVDGKAKIWNLDNGHTLSSFQTPNMANSISFNTQSDKVVVASDCNVIRIYDVFKGTQLDSIEVQGYTHFDYAQFANDDKTIFAYASNNRTIKIFLNNHRWTNVIEPEHDYLTSFSVLPGDSILLLSSKYKNTFTKWNLNNNQSIQLYQGHSKEIHSVNLSHNQQYIISSSSDNNAIIWDNVTGEIIHKLKGHSSQVYFAEFSSSDNYVITASTDGTVKIWNTLTGSEIVTKKSSTSAKYTHMINPHTPQYMIIDDENILLYRISTPTDLINHFESIYDYVSFTQEERELYFLNNKKR